MSKYLIELADHNKEIVDEIIELLSQGKKSIFYSEATGLGKSWVMGALIERLPNKKVLYIVPKKAIWYDLREKKEFSHIISRITMTTYARFNRKNFEEFDDYDVIFIDEAHHIASDIQGKNILELKDEFTSAGKLVFGMTATHTVMGDDGEETNVGDYFEDQVIGYNIVQAIKNNIFPKINYKIAVKDEQCIPDNVKETFNVESTSCLLETVIYEVEKINKWVAFFSDIESLRDAEKDLIKLFPEYKILYIHSKMQNADKILKEFNECNDNVLLLSVSMLLEGLHITSVGGALLYRNVSSKNTFLQIVGRLCNMGRNDSPIFIDVMSSINNIGSFIPFESNNTNGSVNKNTKEIYNISASTARNIDFISSVNNLFNVDIYRGVDCSTCSSMSRDLEKIYGIKVLPASIYNYCDIHKVDRHKAVDHYIPDIYKDINCSTYVDMSRDLEKIYGIKVSDSTIYKYCNNNNVDRYKAVDYFCEEYDPIIKLDNNIYKGIIYKDIDCSTCSSMSRDLEKIYGVKISVSSIAHNCITKNISRQELIDQCANIYKGINCYKYKYMSRDLEKIYGVKVPPTTIRNHCNANKVDKYKAVDHYLEKYSKIKAE